MVLPQPDTRSVGRSPLNDDESTDVSLPPPYDDFDFDKLNDIISDAVKSNAWSNTVWSQVFGGNNGSCVDASISRANDIAASIRGAIASGELNLHGHTVRVGNRSGYQVAGASFHTYTVIEVVDPSGRPVRTIEADNYVFVAPSVGEGRPVNWDDPTDQSQAQHTIPAPQTGQ